MQHYINNETNNIRKITRYILLLNISKQVEIYYYFCSRTSFIIHIRKHPQVLPVKIRIVYNYVL